MSNSTIQRAIWQQIVAFQKTWNRILLKSLAGQMAWSALLLLVACWISFGAFLGMLLPVLGMLGWFSWKVAAQWLGPYEASLLIDREMSLNERISSSFYLLQKPSLERMEIALLNDAHRCLDIRVPSVPRRPILWPAYLALFSFLPAFLMFGPAVRPTREPIDRISWQAVGLALDHASRVLSELQEETLSKRAQAIGERLEKGGIDERAILEEVERLKDDIRQTLQKEAISVGTERPPNSPGMAEKRKNSSETQEMKEKASQDVFQGGKKEGSALAQGHSSKDSGNEALDRPSLLNSIYDSLERLSFGLNFYSQGAGVSPKKTWHSSDREEVPLPFSSSAQETSDWKSLTPRKKDFSGQYAVSRENEREYPADASFHKTKWARQYRPLIEGYFALLESAQE